jgi:hypothetical protein
MQAIPDRFLGALFYDPKTGVPEGDRLRVAAAIEANLGNTREVTVSFPGLSERFGRPTQRTFPILERNPLPLEIVMTEPWETTPGVAGFSLAELGPASVTKGKLPQVLVVPGTGQGMMDNPNPVPARLGLLAKALGARVFYVDAPEYFRKGAGYISRFILPHKKEEFVATAVRRLLSEVDPADWNKMLIVTHSSGLQAFLGALDRLRKEGKYKKFAPVLFAVSPVPKQSRETMLEERNFPILEGEHHYRIPPKMVGRTLLVTNHSDGLIPTEMSLAPQALSMHFGGPELRMVPRPDLEYPGKETMTLTAVFPHVVEGIFANIRGTVLPREHFGPHSFVLPSEMEELMWLFAAHGAKKEVFKF